MESEWKKNIVGWNPVTVMALNESWILEVNKEYANGVLRKIENSHVGEAITAFNGYYDCSVTHGFLWVDIVEEAHINSEGLCEGRICIKRRGAVVGNFRFLVNLKTFKRKVEKI
ncbi:MAG TPA: hypothetical protein VF817_01300 [Patescibacteria group bacterium]